LVEGVLNGNCCSMLEKSWGFDRGRRKLLIRIFAARVYALLSENCSPLSWRSSIIGLSLSP
jgi:hypothetical protein